MITRCRRRSLIAGANAWFRARETARPAGERILHDPWAQRLADRDARLGAIRGLRLLLPALKTVVNELLVAHCVRHRAVDELVLASIRRDGFRQVVVLGAGYDMRASRFAAQLEGVRWIEIDDPLTQARKWRRLAGAPGVRSVCYVPTDLETEPLTATLARAGADPTSATCFVLEGLVHYLSGPALASVLASLGHGHARRRVLLTYIDGEMRRRATPTITNLFRALGEAPCSFPTTEAMTSLLTERGLGRIRSWLFSDQVRQFVSPGPVGRPLETRWWQTVVQADET